MKKYIFAAIFLGQLAFAQSQEAKSFVAQFTGKENQISLHLPKNQKLNLQFLERNNSLSGQGFRSFAGYADGNFVGVISIYNNEVSGNLDWQGVAYQITTEKGKIIIKEDTIKDQCGTHHHDDDMHTHQPLGKSLSKIQAMSINPNQIDNVPEINTDGVLRIYRLAILVDYSKFTDSGSNVNTIKRFWAETETFLNELYSRDLSIKFTIVDNDLLIRKTPSERIFIGESPNYMSEKATGEINKLIGENSYDIGLVATAGNTGQNGVGGLFSVYSQSTKADAWVSILRPSTIAHEIGHLFGASHIYTARETSGGAQDATNTEPGRGQSIMGYSRDLPRDFFSLVSVNTIRKALLNNADYYTDEARTQRVGPHNSGNIVYGIPTQNRPPSIKRSKIKAEYQLPQDTYFQFNIPATDPDGHALLYMAHQADIKLKEANGLAVVRSAKPQSSPIVAFYPQYSITNSGQTVNRVQYDVASPHTLGKRTFWLGASDGGELKQNPNHAVRYDLVETKVDFVTGTAFKITAGAKSSYSSGERVMLRWSVDNRIFGGTKVRILMSDDFGASWKYVLADNVENNGSHEITIPNIELGKKRFSPTVSAGLGLIKIEVIDHIAVAITDNNPMGGGFTIQKSNISFENLPAQHIIADRNQLPPQADVRATTTCRASQNPLQVQFHQTQTDNLITRTWTASDNCNNTATFTQRIELKKEVQSLRFVENLPQNQHIKCPNDPIDAPVNLTATGGTNPQVSFTQTRWDNGDNGKSYTLIRTWRATDPDAEPISHTQFVTIHDGEKPVLSEYPQNITIRGWEDMPQYSITATDNCDGNVPVYQGGGYTETDEQGRNVLITNWTAKDKSGNITRHEQRVTIDTNYVKPTTPPLEWDTASLPQSKTVSCASGVPALVLPRTTGGNGTPTVQHTETIESRTCPNNYVVKRIFTATDGTTNLTHTQTITVEDREKPNFVGNLPSDMTVKEGQIVSQIDLQAQDNCGSATVEKSEREVMENGRVKQKIYTWIAKDVCNNTKEHTQTITFELATPPLAWAVNPLPEVKISCQSELVTIPQPTTTGGKGNVTISHSDSPVANYCDATIVRTYTATDGTNTITTTQNIKVEDKTPPRFEGQLPEHKTIGENDPRPVQVDWVATDNCGVCGVKKTQQEIWENGKLKTIIYKWTATDHCGNTATQTQNIEIR